MKSRRSGGRKAANRTAAKADESLSLRQPPPLAFGELWLASQRALRLISGVQNHVVDTLHNK
jgi:hypothetical protein